MAASELISHGRRKGEARSPVSERQETLRPGQVAVLSGDEWNRLTGRVLSWQQTSAASQALDRQQSRRTLHEKSKAIVENWENTIEGQRLKKLQARKIREEKEEVDRVKVDIAEASFQAERRKEAIERAKTMLYYQTDRVRKFHGALMLSEVLRERDAQVVYKKKKEELVKLQDEKFLQFQEQEREAAILAGMKAAQERTKQRSSVASFQIKQGAEKVQTKLTARLCVLEEQKQLDKEVAEFHETEKVREEKQILGRTIHRKELDQVLIDKRNREKAQLQQQLVDDENIRVFAQAKKKMTTLRKEKEGELFKQFQSQQERMCDQLHAQMQQVTSDEDQRIAKAVMEQTKKREAEERAKQVHFLEATKDINSHMMVQMAELEKKRKDQEQLDQELLKQRIIQDQKFHNQQMDKHEKACREAEDFQQFHHSQISEKAARQQSEVDEDRSYNDRNVDLLQVEETQFQQYANKVINEATSRGAPVKPLRKAATSGAGGGHGPVMSGKGGIRPSYQVLDSTAVELPSYCQHIKPTKTTTKTQNRMGFTW